MTATEEVIECFATVRVPEHGLTFYPKSAEHLEEILRWLEQRGVKAKVELTEHDSPVSMPARG